MFLRFALILITCHLTHLLPPSSPHHHQGNEEQSEDFIPLVLKDSVPISTFTTYSWKNKL